MSPKLANMSAIIVVSLVNVELFLAIAFKITLTRSWSRLTPSTLEISLSHILSK